MTNVLFDTTTICFYLPQFHRTPFNNAMWGAGFTEWTNVALARPRFEGHEQPKVPGELGFYDLSQGTVLEEQRELAGAHGVTGFCFYYYRFGMKRELDLPVARLLANPTPQVPFCLCWANESWTRAWDGRSDDVIYEQDYGPETTRGLIEDLKVSFADQRYIRVAGRPLFIIYQIEHIPNVAEWISGLRELLLLQTGEQLMVGAVFSHGMTPELASLVDIVIQFPPHRIPRKGNRALVSMTQMAPFEPERKDYFEDYGAVCSASLGCVDAFENLVPGACPDWDNSPRRERLAHIIVNSKPELFEGWIYEARKLAHSKAKAGKLPAPLLFVNAWNEWAEGAILEPSKRHGRAYLEALRNGLKRPLG